MCLFLFSPFISVFIPYLFYNTSFVLKNKIDELDEISLLYCKVKGKRIIETFVIGILQKLFFFAGLKIPSDCWLEVNGTQHNWKSEETVVFDDSFEHSATFSEQSSAAQASPRAVLIIDFWHPDITKDEKKILLDLLSP